YASKKVFSISVLMILVGTLALFISNQYFIYAGIALFGLGNSNVFSVLFSQALKEKPEQNNEVSGLMVTGICGGAVFPLIMGILSDSMGSQNGAIFILLLGSLYFLSFLVKKIKS
ncbi:MAG: MFS transporter, partial [Massilibacteroides sp.]|nr:MFS transporter [Massilibacteroides sp.]